MLEHGATLLHAGKRKSVAGVGAAGAGSGGEGAGAGAAEERRYDLDGELYTRAEFVEEYGGTREWDAAERQAPAPAQGKKGKKAGGGGGGGEANGHVARPAAANGGAEGIDEGATAVLIFLPGFKEIQTLHEALLATREYASEPQRSWVLPLHSSLPPEEQRRVFDRPPPGVRKVVLTTNIAETAITVDDVAYAADHPRDLVPARFHRSLASLSQQVRHRLGAHEGEALRPVRHRRLAPHASKLAPELQLTRSTSF